MPALVAAMEIEAVPAEERPELAHRVLAIHARVCEVEEIKNRQVKRARGARG